MRILPRSQRVSLLALFSLAVVWPGCVDSSLDSLAGRWDGTIICAGGDRSEISVGFTVEGATIGGSGFTTRIGVRKEWKISGHQIHCRRYELCADDTCSSDAQCTQKHFRWTEDKPVPFGAPECPALGPERLDLKSRCNQHGQCTPCTTRRDYDRLLIAFGDPHAQIPDPVLNVARDGEQRLSGTLTAYCADEKLLGQPQVVLEKEQP